MWIEGVLSYLVALAVPLWLTIEALTHAERRRSASSQRTPARRRRVPVLAPGARETLTDGGRA
jgi:hypothetical protein